MCRTLVAGRRAVDADHVEAQRTVDARSGAERSSEGARGTAGDEGPGDDEEFASDDDDKGEDDGENNSTEAVLLGAADTFSLHLAPLERRPAQAAEAAQG